MNFFDHSDPFAPFMYTSTRSERSGAARVTTIDDRIRVEVDAPGFDPAKTKVQVRRSNLERTLVVESSIGSVVSTSSKSVQVRLPAAAGAIASPAKFKHGVMTIEFELVDTPGEPVDVCVQS